MPVRTATFERVVRERDHWRESALGASSDAEQATELLGTTMRALLAIHVVAPDGQTCLGCGHLSPCPTGQALPVDQADVAAAWAEFRERDCAPATTTGGAA